MNKMEKCWFNEDCKECQGHYCSRHFNMLHMVEKSGLPLKAIRKYKINAPLEDKEIYKQLEKIQNNIYNFVKEGNNLFLHSEGTGNGKTTWAIKLLLTYLAQVKITDLDRGRGLFLSVPQFLVKLKKSYNKNNHEFDKFCDDLLKVDLVIWDDIAITPLSDNDYLNILSILSHRELAGLANIFTSNQDEEGLYNFLGTRIVSRIWNESWVIEFKAKDFREKIRSNTNGIIANN